METEIIDVVMSIFQVISNDGGLVLSPIKEAVVDSLQECWDLAQQFNKESAGTGFVAVCWPAPTTVLVQ